jgi:AcrR family transcriptional regulator
LYNTVHFFTQLKTKGKHIHRGEVLQVAVRKHKLKITQVVKKLGISRGTFYNHVEDPNLSFEILERYGKALGYDFTADIPEMAKYTFEEPSEIYGQPSTLEEAIKQGEYWKNKYIALLEKHQRLIEEWQGSK